VTRFAVLCQTSGHIKGTPDEAEFHFMSSINRRRGWLVSVVAVGALLAAVAPSAQAQVVKPADRSRPTALSPQGPIKSPLAQSLQSKGKSKSKKAAAPTEVDSVCKVTGYSPTSVTIGSATIKKNFVPTVTGCTLKYWQVWVWPFVIDDEDNYDGISWQDSPTAVLNPHYLLNSYVGTQPGAVTVYAWGEEDPVDDPDYDVQPATADYDFTILHTSSFSTSFDATPEPVKKNAKLTIKGTIKRINFDQAAKLSYVGYPKAPVDIQFQAAGTTTWTTVNTQKAGTGGTISTRVVATKTGNWRLSFAGNGATAPTISGVDAVTVN
jgi:hypothetical protein